MKTSLLFILGMILLFGCQTTMPPKNDEPFKPFGYVQGGILYGFQQFDFSDIEDDIEKMVPFQVDLDADNSPGFDLRIGSRVHPYAAVEAQVQHFFGGDIDSKVSNLYGYVKNTVAEYSATAWTVNLKGYAMRPEEAFQPYGLIGIGIVNVDIDNKDGYNVFDEDTTETMMKFGAGFDVKATEQLFLFLEIDYLAPSGDLKDFNMVPLAAGAGIQFRF